MRGQLITEVKGHTARPEGCCEFSNNAKAISTSDDNTLRVWDLATGQVKVLSRTVTTGIYHLHKCLTNSRSASCRALLTRWWQKGALAAIYSTECPTSAAR